MTRSGRLRRTATVVGAMVAVIAAVAVPSVSTSAATRHAARPAEAVSSEVSLNAISCQTLTSCWSVGYAGTNPSDGKTLARRWRSKRHEWVRVATPNPAHNSETSFSGVSCAAPSSCMAVGNGEREGASGAIDGVTEHWNGHHWTIVPLPDIARYPTTSLDAVSCPDRTDCFAVGSYVTHPSEGDSALLIEHWDGHAWSVQAAPHPFASSALYGISCTSASSCVAVGYDEPTAYAYPLTEYWDGTSWSRVGLRESVDSQSMRLGGVSCGSPSSCLAVGDYNANNARGTNRVLAEGVTVPATAALLSPRNVSARRGGDNFWATSCTSATHCMVTGQQETDASGLHVKPLTERWNGTTWTITATPKIRHTSYYRLLGVGCPTASDCFAVGMATYSDTDTRAVIERWNGHTWHVISD